MQDRHWVFWNSACSAGEINYATSTDGVAWSSIRQIQPYGSGGGVNIDYGFATWFNGTHLFYTAGGGGFGQPFVFRMGLPQRNGTLIWSAPQQIINATSPAFQDVKTDSLGYQWVTWSDFNGNAYAIKNLRRDGTWQPSVTFTLSAQKGANYEPEIVPLTNGKMYFDFHVVSGAQPNIYGKLWNGSFMGPQEIVSTNTAFFYTSSVSANDNVYIVYPLASNNSILFQTRFYKNGSWSPPVQINPADGNRGMVSFSLIGGNQVIAFWLNHPTLNTAYYRVYTISTKTWGPTAIWLTEPSGFTIDESDPGRPGTFYQDYGNNTVSYLGFQYSAGNSAPYSIKYAFLTFTPTRTLLFTQNFPSVVVTP